jgi:hypothetical protein
MPRYKVRINGTAEFEVNSGAGNASQAAEEIHKHVREGDGNEHEIRLFWDHVAVLEVTKVSD